MKTIFKNPSEFDRKWYLIDAEGKTLGRLASKIAFILRGKNKSYYTPHQECGDFVVVINSEKIVVTGRKQEQKKYYRHSGYPGGLKEQNFLTLLKKHPTRPLEKAIRGMLPHNRLGRKLFNNVKVYTSANHPHNAQKPIAIEL